MEWLLQQAHIASSPAMSGAGQSPGAEESFIPDQDVRRIVLTLLISAAVSCASCSRTQCLLSAGRRDAEGDGLRRRGRDHGTARHEQ